MDTTETTPLLSVSEVAERLSISSNRAYLLVTDGDLKASKIGGQWRIKPEDLEAYIAANSNQPADKAVQ